MTAEPAPLDEDLQALLDAAPDATLVVGEDGVIEHANRQCQALLGYSPQELVGMTVEALIPAGQRLAHVAHRQRYQGAPVARLIGTGLELAALHRDGRKIPVEISLSPVRTRRRRCVCAALRDVTGRRSREAELEAARRAADAANATKSEFLASMSHELRTPLNAILGFAQLLQRDKKTPLADRQRAWVEHVLRGGQHLLRLIDEVLDLASIESGHLALNLEPVDADLVLTEVLATLAPIGERHHVALGAPVRAAELPVVQADRIRLVQVLLNYGANAIKYGRAGGRAVFTAYAADGRVRITVSDNGVGIPEDKQALLFQPFQRAGQETGAIEGTGIGLAICKRLAEAMHGTVGFRSTPGLGSDFWIELPFDAAQARRGRVASPSEDGGARQRPAGAPQTVLYIEDNPANLAFMQAYFSTHEHLQLLSAPSGELGLELARAYAPALILLDIHLPGIDGHEVLRRLRGQPETARIRVVAVSAVGNVQPDAGFDRVLAKPLQIAMLDAMIAEYLPEHRGAASS